MTESFHASPVRAKNLAGQSSGEATMHVTQLIQAAANVGESISQLPAVATLDWCDRAAAALVGIPHVSFAGVLICTVDESGRILDLEAAGFATPSSGRVASAAPHEGLEVARELRYRAEHIDHIGWAPGLQGLSFTQPVTSSLAALPGGSVWRQGSVGRLLGDVVGDDIIVGAAAIGQNVRGRCLVALIGPEGSSSERLAEIIAFAESFVPAISRRALQAIGPARSKRNQWLSPREQVVLDLLTLGMSVRQIADELKRSPHTVHDHVKALHRKLSASSRGELVARALGHVGGPESQSARMAKAEMIERTLDPQQFAEPKDRSTQVLG